MSRSRRRLAGFFFWRQPWPGWALAGSGGGLWVMESEGGQSRVTMRLLLGRRGQELGSISLYLRSICMGVR